MSPEELGDRAADLLLQAGTDDEADPAGLILGEEAEAAVGAADEVLGPVGAGVGNGATYAI